MMDAAEQFNIHHSLFAIHRRLVRWAFERLYRELSWTYDAVAWLVSRGLWRRWALAALPYTQGRVLELGPGPGHLQLALAARPGPPPIGLDASPQMAARASRRLRAAGRAPRLIRGLAQAIPLPDASVDTVVATFPADYILDPRTHAEIARVLAPAGRLVIVDAAQFRGAGPYERLVDLAYRLTLQSSTRAGPPPQARAERLRLAGLALSPHWAEVGPSRVMVLLGERP